MLSFLEVYYRVVQYGDYFSGFRDLSTDSPNVFSLSEGTPESIVLSRKGQTPLHYGTFQTTGRTIYNFNLLYTICQ